MIKRPLTVGIGLMMLFTLLTYANHFTNSFHFDDFHTIVNNANIRSLKNVPNFFADGRTSSVLPQNQAYRPVVVTSLAFDYWLGGDYYPSVFLASSFMMFLIQGYLMLLFFKKIFDESLKLAPTAWLALVAVAWYLVHPANAETVNYVIARTDILSTLLVLLGFILYIFSPFCRKTFLYLVIIGLAILSKASAVMFAPLLFFYILLFETKIGLADLFKKAHLKDLKQVFMKTLPSLIFCALMYELTVKMTPSTWEAGGNQPLQYLITQPFVIVHYFCTFFLPTGLSADTDWKLLPNIWNIRFFAGCIFIIAMIIAAFYTSKSKRMRPISFGILWFFITLVPTSSIIPLGEVLNDHRMYFPFVGLVMSVTWAIGLLLMRYGQSLKKPVIFVPGLLLLCAYAYGTYQRNIVWHTERSLWQDVTIKSPQNGRGQMNYATALMADGEYTAAEAYLTRASQLTQGYSFLYTNLGIVKEKEGQPTRAEYYYKEGAEIGANYPDPLVYYAMFLIKQYRYDEAEPLLKKAIKLSPLYVVPHEQLMFIYSMEGKFDLLRETAQQTLKLAPQNTVALNYLTVAAKKVNELDIEADKIKAAPTAEKYADLSLLNYQAKRYPQCIITAQEALRLKPGFAEAYNNMGAAYIKLQQYDKAVDALKEAIRLKPDLTVAQNNLIDAAKGALAGGIRNTKLNADDFIDLSLYYFNNGLFADCIKACEFAISLNHAYDIPYNNICAAYNKLGKWDEAIAAAKKGLLINPHNQVLKNNMAVSIKGKNGVK